MNKSPSIFQEIERKLAKDHYASQLPTYHPAKGRRKRILKKPAEVYQNRDSSHSNPKPKAVVGFTDFDKGRPNNPFPDTPPEIGQPGETDIPTPGEREINPGRDFPQPDMPDPDEEEIPGERPQPELDPNRIGKST